MKILVLGNDSSWNEINGSSNDIVWVRVNNMSAFMNDSDADAFFNLFSTASLEDYRKIEKPVFINSVSSTLHEIHACSNVTRINGWNGFLKRHCWELAGTPDNIHLNILKALQKEIIITPDEPGFISARIIAMIINEAFFAKGENVSTESEIDIAMKLGTNYPLGPFEWANEIGIENIYDLLASLSKNDSRYTPSPLLTKKAKVQ